METNSTEMATHSLQPGRFFVSLTFFDDRSRFKEALNTAVDRTMLVDIFTSLSSLIKDGAESVRIFDKETHDAFLYDINATGWDNFMDALTQKYID